MGHGVHQPVSKWNIIGTWDSGFSNILIHFKTQLLTIYKYTYIYIYIYLHVVFIPCSDHPITAPGHALGSAWSRVLWRSADLASHHWPATPSTAAAAGSDWDFLGASGLIIHKIA